MVLKTQLSVRLSNLSLACIDADAQSFIKIGSQHEIDAQQRQNKEDKLSESYHGTQTNRDVFRFVSDANLPLY